MKLYYYFGDSDDAYEYDADLDEFIDSLNTAQICKLAGEIYDSEFISNDVKQECETEYNCISSDFFKNYEDNDVQDCARYIIEESDDNVIAFLLEDTVKDFYREQAYEEYKDAEEYRKDPYSYNGVNPNDF